MDYKEYAPGEEIPPLRLAGTVEDSIVDGPGIRYTIFVQGCPHHCPGCHNPQTHDFAEAIWRIRKFCWRRFVRIRFCPA